MSGAALLFLSVLIVSLPLVPAWFYFHKRGLNARWFFLCLGTGFAAVLLVLAAKLIIPASDPVERNFVLYVFGQIAFIEELSRLAILFPVLSFALRKRGDDFNINHAAWGATAGLLAGLGFAVAESAFYAGADFGIILLRAFSAAPLHGACGARIGTAFGSVRSRPLNAAYLILSAVLIHGLYDFFILEPNLPSFLSLLIAYAALGSSLLALRNE